VIDQEKFFRTLGRRIRALRKRSKYTQEDMISFGFSARHWQQIEAGRPITVRTLLRICDTFGVRLDRRVWNSGKLTINGTPLIPLIRSADVNVKIYADS
jgi:transcriptional regulator with XRE-family HTH domain